MEYDIIGDIHGHANDLIALLEKLGYEDSGGYYQHPSKKVVFLGEEAPLNTPVQTRPTRIN